MRKSRLEYFESPSAEAFLRLFAEFGAGGGGRGFFAILPENEKDAAAMTQGAAQEPSYFKSHTQAGQVAGARSLGEIGPSTREGGHPLFHNATPVAAVISARPQGRCIGDA